LPDLHEKYKTLNDIFKEVISDKKIWSYYPNESIRQDELKRVKQLTNSKDFISKYLEEGCKAQSLSMDKYFSELLSEIRAKHTVSIFFIGLYIYKNCAIIKEKIDIKLNELRTKVGGDISIKFNYYWFLICFYHDIAHCYETADYSLDYIEENQISLKQLNALPDISFDLPPFNNSVPDIYTSVWYNYYRYRTSQGKNDHGIFGGLLLYNDMKLNYDKYRNELNNPKEPFEKNKVWWSKKILSDVHGYVAWMIMAHNIWFLFNDDPHYERKRIEYEKYELNELILTGDNTVITLDHPFLYLLSIVDTIDPVKIIKNPIDILEALSKIYIMADGSELIIKMDKNIIGDCEKYQKGINDLKKWVDLTQFKVSLE
jgi:hypothetical protein